MTEREKVTIDEIIGIVKTDEQTNSVQLKKEAQLNICEKRLIELEKKNEQLKQDLIDKKRLISYMSQYTDLSFDEIVDEILNNEHYDKWWGDNYYEYVWKLYLQEQEEMEWQRNDLI